MNKAKHERALVRREKARYRRTQLTLRVRPGDVFGGGTFTVPTFGTTFTFTTPISATVRRRSL